MAYENYSNQPAGYGQSNPYGGGPSPYGQAGNPYDQDTSYDSGNPYSQGQYDRQGHEMTNMNGSDPNRILNECRQIDAEVDQLDARQERLRQMQRAFIGDTDTSAESQTRRQVDAESADLLQDYRALVARTKRVKQDKESGNPRNAPQVGRVDRKVKGSMNKLQQLDSDFRRQLQDRMERDYRIVRPDASDAEVREAVQDPNQQVFSQALISSDRRGQAQSVAQSVRSRHNAIQKIEQDMLQLAEMFQDLDALVIQQEAAVTQIEQRGEEVTDHAAKANTELDGAVKKARAARKKKWICLGIAAAILEFFFAVF
ncbi:hypothetical protein PMZ80_004534 [Knufia obscura]|uniref:t-SNARE coiled-coil homology domain-containing protein n=1 Tax=Knufia obscura TaxID=1635080 RepID=A0ABR0RSD3_9EURO|nr:hypothetical protein PMZ80_004534 [Knufia obscura]